MSALSKAVLHFFFTPEIYWGLNPFGHHRGVERGKVQDKYCSTDGLKLRTRPKKKGRRLKYDEKGKAKI